MDSAGHHGTTTPHLLTDDRIGLRPLTVDDADAHWSGCDEVIIERLGDGVPPSRGGIEAWLATNAQAWASGGDVVDLGIEDLRPVVEFVIRAAPDNPESIAVAERAGFERSGQTDDTHGELVWLTRRA